MCSLPPVGGASCDSRLKRTVCISCGCLQTSKLPSARRDVCETPSLMAGGCVGWGCVPLAMLYRCSRQSVGLRGMSAVLWRRDGRSSCVRRGQEKSPDSCESGLSFGAGEMNRTPDLLITNSSTNCFQLLPIAVFTLDGVILAARNNRDLCRNLAATVT